MEDNRRRTRHPTVRRSDGRSPLPGYTKDAFRRCFSGLGQKIAIAAYVNGMATSQLDTSDDESGFRKSLERQVVQALDENVTQESTSVSSLGELIDRISLSALRNVVEAAYAEGHVPGTKWGKKPALLTQEEFVEKLDALDLDVSSPAVRPHDLAGDMTFRVRRFADEAAIEAQRKGGHLSRSRLVRDLPGAVWQTVVKQMQMIAICTTGEHFVDRIKSGDRRIIASA